MRSPEQAIVGGLQSLPPRLVRLASGAPIVVDGQTLDPHLQVILRLYRLARRPKLSRLDPRRARREAARTLRAFAAPTPLPLPEVRDVSLDVGDRSLAARLYRPVAPAAGTLAPVVLYLHGGGHCVGDLDTHDGPCRMLAKETGAVVLAVDYRLAPEAPFPAAVDDAVAALRWVRDRGDSLWLDAGRLAVAGDSAGGNLAAAACLALARAGEPGPRLQVLFYPLTDARCTLPAQTLFAEGFGLERAEILWFRHHYLGDTDRTDTRVSVLLAEDLSGVAPAYISTAGFDPLRDDGAAYAARMREADVPVEHVCHTSLIHGFVSFCAVHEPSAVALRGAASAIRSALFVR